MVLVGLAAAVVPGWVTPLPPVLEAQLIEPEPAPVTPARRRRRARHGPARADHAATARGGSEAAGRGAEGHGAAQRPGARAVAVAPASAAGPPPRETLPFAVAASEPAAAPAELPAAVGRPATPAAAPVPPPAVAKAAPDEGITRMATPTGGYQVRPSYPSTARRLGVEGTTLLRVYVAADGRVTDVQVDQSAGHPDLDRAAAEAVRRWKFEPGASRQRARRHVGAPARPVRPQVKGTPR